MYARVFQAVAKVNHLSTLIQAGSKSYLQASVPRAFVRKPLPIKPQKCLKYS